ncbi:MAG: pyridoxal-phosphate dependent enzyme, partial [Chloroflexi bacterium]|nr:pyridoxal-phosphate dependent enzyme [Chloroflexota bacterium]
RGPGTDRWWLACRTCGQQATPDDLGSCPMCAEAGRVGVREVQYAAVRDGDTSAAAPVHGASGIWRWQQLLPLPLHARPLSLGEGWTPLLAAQRALAGCDRSNVYLKYEGVNPTHAFKDRFQAVSISAATGFGYADVVCSSTGNHGVAAAAYAARAGMRCAVLLHEEAPQPHAAAIRLLGGLPVTVPPAERAPLLRRLVEGGWYPSTGFWPLPVSSPYGVEGYKTIAYELAEQLGAERIASANVFVPVGGGDCIYGLYKGWSELVALGFLARLPRIFACQPDGAAPLVEAERSGSAHVGEVAVRPSLALSIRESVTGDHGLEAVRNSGGQALALSDASIVDAQERLARDGLTVDPASAASLGGVLSLSPDRLAPDALVVCLLTASGARWPRPEAAPAPGKAIVASTVDQALAQLGSR